MTDRLSLEDIVAAHATRTTAINDPRKRLVGSWGPPWMQCSPALALRGYMYMCVWDGTGVNRRGAVLVANGTCSACM
eukprot:972498-Prymnesium_polylepis.1